MDAEHTPRPISAALAQANRAENDRLYAYLHSEVHRKVLRKAIENAEHDLHLATKAGDKETAEALGLELKRLTAEYDEPHGTSGEVDEHQALER